MIVGNVATLAVRGQTPDASAQYVTQVLGIEPTDWGEVGDEHISAKRPRRPRDGQLRKQTMWALKVEDEGESGDETGFASLRALLVLLRDKRDALQTLELGDQYEVWIS